jgi:hypothetical protein
MQSESLKNEERRFPPVFAFPFLILNF